MNPYKVIEIDLGNEGMPGITYDVTVNYEILVCPIYTRHKILQQASGFPALSIAWGGILDEQGTWVRGSFDFGDCEEEEDKQEVLRLIREHFGLKDFQ